VRGSAPLAAVPVAADDGDTVVADVEVVAAVAVGDGLVEGAAAVVGALAGVLELEPEFDELPEPPFEPFEPPRGSVYCWSPADVPEASATGASSIRPTTTTRK
jgi:hypothetical protein